MPDSYILTRAAELDALASFREFIARVCEPRHIPTDIIFQMQLACDEAAANVIQHGYAGMNPGSIMLELRPAPRRLTMILSDFGHPFEPADQAAPDVQAILHNEPSTGFGLYFIYQTMNQINYYSDEQGNHLVMVKNLTPQD